MKLVYLVILTVFISSCLINTSAGGIRISRRKLKLLKKLAIVLFLGKNKKIYTVPFPLPLPLPVINKIQPIIYRQRVPYPVEVPVPVPYAEPVPYPVEVPVDDHPMDDPYHDKYPEDDDILENRGHDSTSSRRNDYNRLINRAPSPRRREARRRIRRY